MFPLVIFFSIFSRSQEMVNEEYDGLKAQSTSVLKEMNYIDENITLNIPAKFVGDIASLSKHRALFINVTRHLYCKFNCGQFEFLIDDELCCQNGMDQRVRLFLVLRLWRLYENHGATVSLFPVYQRREVLMGKAELLVAQLYNVVLTEEMLSNVEPYLLEWCLRAVVLIYGETKRVL